MNCIVFSSCVAVKLIKRTGKIDKDGSCIYSNIIVLKPTDKINITLYPNPAKDFITLSVNKLSTNNYVLITNMNGKVVQKIQLKESVNNISTSCLQNGTYLIQLFQNNTLIATQPFIISKN